MLPLSVMTGDRWTGMVIMCQHSWVPCISCQSTVHVKCLVKCNINLRGHVWALSPLVSFQFPSAASRLTLEAMAVMAPVCTDWTNAPVLTPRTAPRANRPSHTLLPLCKEGAFPWLDVPRAVVVVENFLAGGAELIWPRRGLVAGFPPSWGLRGDKMWLNLTPALWKWRTRDRGPRVHRTALICDAPDICSAMPVRQQAGPITASKDQRPVHGRSLSL